MPMLLDDGPDNLPLYLQLAAILKDRIDRGTWSDGSKLPSEKRLCEEFQVARGTVRQALQTLENQGYVLREQGRGTFVRLSRIASESRTVKRLAFIVPYVRDTSVPTILIGFQQVAEQAGFSVIFNHVNNDVQQQERVLRNVIDEHVSGIALYPVDSESISAVENLSNSGFPLVLIDRYVRNRSTDYVMVDHFGSAIRATQYLFDQGHVRVGFVTWLSAAVSMEHRFLGYKQALSERGVDLDSQLICQVEGYPVVDISPLRNYLSAPNRPTAVFASNDQIAIGLYRAAASVGLSIPEDLSVVGFDNLDLTSHLEPPLTTMAQPFMRIGQTAAEQLLRRINGDRDYFAQINLPAELVIRDSCRRLEHDIFEPIRARRAI